MRAMTQDEIDELSRIIAEAARLPLIDAAFTLWRQRYRLDVLLGRMPPTPEQVAAYRAMTPEQRAAKYRYDREHAHEEGPMFELLQRAHPGLDDALVRRAIAEAVKFEDDTFKHFSWDGDFWDSVVRAVAQAQRKHPHYLEATYRDARNNVAYYYK
jgi:hypothetical protein